MTVELLGRLRAICLSLPETSERLSHGEPCWFIRDKKLFVMFANQHHDERVGFWCGLLDDRSMPCPSYIVRLLV